jgi:hypothetical protein
VTLFGLWYLASSAREGAGDDAAAPAAAPRLTPAEGAA